MSKERHKGTHLGYLEYHAQVLQDNHEELVSDLEEIRGDHTGEERYRKEQQRLLEYHNNVSERVGKTLEQIDEIKKHESEDVRSRAKDIKESAHFAHQEDDLEDIPNNTGFKPATEYSE